METIEGGSDEEIEFDGPLVRTKNYVIDWMGLLVGINDFFMNCNDSSTGTNDCANRDKY